MSIVSPRLRSDLAIETEYSIKVQVDSIQLITSGFIRWENSLDGHFEAFNMPGGRIIENTVVQILGH